MPGSADVPIAAPTRCPVCSAPPAEPAIPTGTQRSVIVVLGEITQPPPTPATSSGAITANPVADGGASAITSAVAASPSTTIVSPVTVSAQPNRSTSRPPITDDT